MRIISNPVTRQGYRHFQCDADGDDGVSCHRAWREATRDCFSPSGENCPTCGAWVFPHRSEPDATLPVDRMGNIVWEKIVS